MKRAALITIALLLIAGSAAALRWRSTYEPLAVEMEAVTLGDHITGVEHPGGALLATTSRTGDFQDVADDDPGAPEHVVTKYVDGEHLTYAVALHNRGRVGVTVTGFDALGPKQFGLLALTDVQVGRRLPTGTSVVHTTSRRSFTLHAGETRDVVFHWRLHACEYSEPGTSSADEALSVRYRVLGLSRHVLLPTPMRIEVKLADAAACPRGTFTSAEHGLEFNYPDAWRAQQFASEPHLVTYLSNVTLHDPCHDKSCAEPTENLPPNSVLIAWYDGPKGRVATPNMRVGGAPAHKTYRRNGCPGIGDEEITVRFDNPAQTTTYTVNACLRGPDVKRLRAQVDAMLASLQFS